MTHTRRLGTHALRAAAPLAAIAVAAVGLTSCGDDPFLVRWTLNPDTVLLYSLDRPELNLPSAYNFYLRTALPVESPASTGNWDVAVDTEGGQIVLLPPGALGVVSRAAIATVGALSYDAVTEAPADTASYTLDQPVPLTVGTIYAIRTGRSAGFFGTTCVYYAKFEPLEVDPVAGTLRFVFDGARSCNDRSFVPPD